IPPDVLVQFIRWSIFFKPAAETRFLAFLSGVAISAHTQRSLVNQIAKNPEVVDTQDVMGQGVAGRSYVAAILHLLTTIATTSEARDMCAESFVTVARWVDLFEQCEADADAFGFVAIKYLDDVLLQHDDCVYKMDDALHVRLFGAVRRFSLCIRRHVHALAQLDMRDDKAAMGLSNDVPMIKHVLPMLVTYFPKLNPALLRHEDVDEWLAAWFVWVFCAVSRATLTDAGVESALHLCMRWLDQLWKPTSDSSSLQQLFDEGCRRSARPFLGVGLSGLAEPFVMDFDKPFVELVNDVHAYRVYCASNNPTSAASSPAPPDAVVMPIVPLEDKLPPLHVDIVRKQSWLPSWGRSKKKRHTSAVVPSNGKSSKSSPRAFNMPSFGAYSGDDCSIVADFVQYVRDHRQTKSAIRNELSAMMQSIVCLEVRRCVVASALMLRQDALKEEHASHAGVPAVISTFDEVAAKLMLKHARFVKMSVVLLDVFTRTILSIEHDRKRRQMQLQLDHVGLTAVLVDLISHTDDVQVFDRCVWLGIAMLDGMNARVQERFHALLTQHAACLGKFKLHLDMLTHTDGTRKPRPVVCFSPKTTTTRTDEPATKYQSAARQFRFLQLLCEGHYGANQQCMLGDYPGGVNLVDVATAIVVEFHTNGSWDAMALLRQVFDTITEFCQVGPCPEAQLCVANYKLISAVNALLWRDTNDLTVTAVDLVRQLKASVVVTLLSLVERRVDHEIHRRLVQELNLEAIKANLIVVHDYFAATYHYDGNVACSRDAFLTMGFNLYILMQHLVEFEPSLLSTLYPADDVAYRTAYAFFDDRCARVEIVWPTTRDPAARPIAGDLVSIYFPLHPICVCLTDRAKRRLLDDVSRDANRLDDFYDKTHVAMLEMHHQCTLRGHAWMALLTQHLSQLKLAAFVWSVFLNGLIVVYNELDSRTPFAVQVVGYVHVALCAAIVAGHCINDVPLLLVAPAGAHRHNDHTTLRFDSSVEETLHDVEAKVRAVSDDRLLPRRRGWFVLSVVLCDAKTMYHVSLLALAVGGAVLDMPLLFAFHVLDVVNQSTELRYISKAIVHPGKSLMHILILYMLSAYVFGFVGATYFSAYFEKDGYNGCTTLWACFLTSVDEGFKNNGGIGGYLVPSRRNAGDRLAYPRFVYDMLYYVGLVVILTNVAFGLIIDTFATLRTQHKEKQDDLKDRCFICSIDCYTFNRMTKGFEHHTRYEHNMWHYIYLFVHVRHKKFTEYNGVELYLATRMAKRDVTFLPSHRALALEKHHGTSIESGRVPSMASCAAAAIVGRPPHVGCFDGQSAICGTTGEEGATGVGASTALQDQLTEMVHGLHAQQQEILALLHKIVATRATASPSTTPRHDRRKSLGPAKSPMPQQHTRDQST
ncbi:hypothetical protein DYB32_009686, partial [Aphanomyces invadans]